MRVNLLQFSGCCVMSKTYIIDALRLHLKARNITYKDLR